MPRDLPFHEFPQRTPIRSAVLDLIAQAGGARPEEPDFFEELCDIVASGRTRADELWEKYRGGAGRRAAYRRFD
jgi:hypothetical protein